MDKDITEPPRQVFSAAVGEQGIKITGMDYDTKTVSVGINPKGTSVDDVVYFQTGITLEGPIEDFINNPPHYTQGIECADYIESHEMDFFQGNAVKYLTRFKLKGTPLEDLQKAEWYVKRLIEQCKKELAKHEKK